MTGDTIVAVATPPGYGGVGVVRLSGSLSHDIIQKITRKTIVKPRFAYYCAFYSMDHEVIDEGIVLYFKAPSSFTGEDVIEIQAHGSPIVLDALLAECVHFGARLAQPGEFSERAFLNGKMDLTQAEAIADLIHASSQTAARMAIQSMQGAFSTLILSLSEKIIQLRLYIEAAIDFPDEEIDFLSEGKVSSKLSALLEQLDKIRSSATQGALIREGLSIVIAGRPNAGKSTLINALAGRDVAIVTPIAGTTRDVMREHVMLDDLPLHLIDTAGLRDSRDEVEQEGIKRAWQEVRKADCLLMVIDVCDETGLTQLSESIRAELPSNVPIIRIFNKIDQIGMRAKGEDDTVYLSAKSEEGLPLLKEKIKGVVGYKTTEGQFLARRRHLDALDAVKSFLLAGQSQLSTQRASELLAEDLRLAHQALGEITGEFTSDDLLGKIFSSFCIGK